MKPTHRCRRLSVALLTFVPYSLLSPPVAASPEATTPRPNVLWITSEDNGPHLGCYGDAYSDTPNLDAFAAKSLRYLNCWSTAPVCAPARTTIISGLYPTSTGAEHMRSQLRLPSEFRMYPQYLRDAGYYCTNNSKEDYNLEKPGKVWDESSRKAHWRNRKAGQPFFAIFNHTISHESKIRNRPHTAVHDPKKVRVPAYHPDTPEVRRDWAQYYDRLTEMDALVGKSLRELEAAGLSDDTIVFYYGDHGSGMPRSKRWPYNSGLHVPLIVHVPEKFSRLAPPGYEAGGKTDRLVGFIDLAPTLLSIVGLKAPAHFQGHAFLGKHTAAEQPYAFGFRGRMDERYDLVRSVRDKRYVYLRHFMPHKIYGQHVNYMFKTPTTQVWRRLFDEGKLNPEQARFWQTKPHEELYDLDSDPDEVRNLASDPQHQKTLQRFRSAQEELARRIRDVGFLPEGEIHSRSVGTTPYEMARQDGRYPVDRVFAMASSAAGEGRLDDLRVGLQDGDSAVRYWAALGILRRGSDAVAATQRDLEKMLDDKAPYPRLVAAEALAHHAPRSVRGKALDVLVHGATLTESSLYVALWSLNALDQLDEKAASAKARIAALPRRTASVPGRLGNYVPRLLEKILKDLQ